MDYNHETDPASEPGNAKSLKDAFYELVENDEDLYTKIVIYEPLSLESLHSRLKQNGVKCKINELMDFLDHQVRNIFEKNFSIIHPQIKNY